MVTCWKDVTLSQYFEYAKIVQSDESDEIKTIDLLKLFSDVPNFEDCTLKQLQGKLPDLSFLTSEPKTIEVPTTVPLNGREFVVANSDTITAWQFVSYQTAIKRQTQTFGFYAAVIASLLCEKGKQYSRGGAPSAEDVATMPCELAFSLMTFFLPKSLKLLKDSQTFLADLTVMQTLNANLTAAAVSTINGGGSQ